MADVGRRTTHLGSHWKPVARGKTLLVRALLRFCKEIQEMQIPLGNKIIGKHLF